MHLPIPTPHHKVPDQKPTRNLWLKPRLQPALTWKLESMIAGFDFEKRESPRDTDRESMEDLRGKIPSRVETSKPVVPFHSSEASSSELQQVSA